MPRRKGNPQIKQHSYKSGREKPLTHQLSVKIDTDMHEALEALGDRKADFIRDAIQDALDKLAPQNVDE